MFRKMSIHAFPRNDDPEVGHYCTWLPLMMTIQSLHCDDGCLPHLHGVQRSQFNDVIFLASLVWRAEEVPELLKDDFDDEQQYTTSWRQPEHLWCETLVQC